MASPDEWFSQNLDRFLDGTLERYKVLDLGLSPDLGIRRFPRAAVMMPQSVLRKIVEIKHKLPIDLLRPLPSLLSQAVRVFRSKHNEFTAVFELPATFHGESLVLVAEYRHHRDFGTAYLVTTVHPRPRHQLDAWTDLGLLLYERL